MPPVLQAVIGGPDQKLSRPPSAYKRCVAALPRGTNRGGRSARAVWRLEDPTSLFDVAIAALELPRANNHNVPYLQNNTACASMSSPADTKAPRSKADYIHRYMCISDSPPTDGMLAALATFQGSTQTTQQQRAQRRTSSLPDPHARLPTQNNPRVAARKGLSLAETCATGAADREGKAWFANPLCRRASIAVHLALHHFGRTRRSGGHPPTNAVSLFLRGPPNSGKIQSFVIS